jgi:hypothetical protein
MENTRLQLPRPEIIKVLENYARNKEEKARIESQMKTKCKWRNMV